jgi:flavin reductase (DIM6/NTAB) family NADH-FMN oxidoreductase RutF
VANLESPILDARTTPMSGATPAADAAAFRHAMREFANGVALITTAKGSVRAGCTATSFCSLSLEPPTLIVCMARNSSTLATLRTSLSIVAGDREALADRFAGRNGEKGPARFAGAEWITLATGAPLLGDALAAMDCRVEEILDRHTHAIVIGRVEAVHRGAGAAALVHWRGRYQSLDQN